MMKYGNPRRTIFIRDDIGVQANRRLAEKHAYLLKTQSTSGLRLKHVIEMPLFVRSELSNGVQLADFISYNFYHAYEYDKPDYPFLQKILPRVYSSQNTYERKLDGIKVFPPESELTKITQRIEKAFGET